MSDYVVRSRGGEGAATANEGSTPPNGIEAGSAP